VSESGLIAAIARITASEDPAVMDLLVEGLENGHLTSNSTAGAVQRQLSVPMERVEAIRALLRQTDSLGSGELALLIRSSMATRRHLLRFQATVEVAATHPRLVPQVRTTGGVARDVIAGAKQSLLVVGYSVTTDQDMSGLASKTLVAMGDAAGRGVKVTAVLHRKDANRAALLRAWGTVLPGPDLFTWPEQPDDRMASLHAKVLVADRSDALVTSANLTFHGFAGNVEMGVRVTGPPAATVSKVFETLIRSGELVRWSP
jgi:phosphatidylserine/phosphatidylglycerophosphate/cardiolipin synthase-like enzyme